MEVMDIRCSVLDVLSVVLAVKYAIIYAKTVPDMETANAIIREFIKNFPAFKLRVFVIFAREKEISTGYLFTKVRKIKIIRGKAIMRHILRQYTMAIPSRKVFTFLIFS
jgi:hypothetical protein